MEEAAALHANNFNSVKFDADIDLVCKMPLSIGIADTIHYQGKVYGFCVAGCKEKFLANPSAY